MNVLGKGKSRYGINWIREISKEEQDEIKESELYNDILNLMGIFDILAGDLGRVANWGLYEGRPVIIDMGFDSDIQNTYYNLKR